MSESKAGAPPDDVLAVTRTEEELRKAILEQTARVINLKRFQEIEATTRMLISLKEEFKGVAGREWSDVREEGPILLTTNSVDGREVLPQLGGRLKQLRTAGIIR